jgi:glycosyltransferase involved in cell wall biosynthesis
MDHSASILAFDAPLRRIEPEPFFYSDVVHPSRPVAPAQGPKLRLLVDCLPLSQGGGVQGAVAFLHNLARAPDIAWTALVPLLLETALPADIRFDPRIVLVDKRSSLDRIRLHGALRRFEREFSPDVVFSVFGPPFFRARAPHVVGFAMPLLVYDRLGGRLAQPLMERLTDPLRVAAFRRADHLVVETETIRGRVARRLAIEPAAISVVGNGVNPILEAFAAVPPPSGRFAILVPAAYYRHKNLGIVPAVAARLRALDPSLGFEFRFTLDPRSAHWRRLVEDAEALAVADALVAVGVLPLPALAQAYRDCSAVFLPSLREASSAVYPESFHFERPLVASDTDFARELCGEAALYAEPSDAEALARRLLDVARRPELRERLVAAGRRRLRRYYPSAQEKFAAQIAVLRSVARGETVSERHSRALEAF